MATVGYLIEHPEVYARLEATTAAIAEGVERIAREAGVALTTNRVGSMFTWFFTERAVANFNDAATSDTAAFARFHRGMLDSGIWLPPSQYEAAFVSVQHGAAELEWTLAGARKAFARV
jgi:glutamate-1-semialdehyde 2,1-aminomutase